MAFDLLDEPIVQAIIGVAVLAVGISVISLIRSWRAEWRSPLWDEDDTTLDPFDAQASEAPRDGSWWEVVRDVLGSLGDGDGD